MKKDMIDVISSFLEKAQTIEGFNLKYFLSQLARLTNKVVNLQRQNEKQAKRIESLENQLQEKQSQMTTLEEQINEYQIKQKKFEYIIKEYDALTPTDKLIHLKKFNKKLNKEVEQIS